MRLLLIGNSYGITIERQNRRNFPFSMPHFIYVIIFMNLRRAWTNCSCIIGPTKAKWHIFIIRKLMVRNALLQSQQSRKVFTGFFCWDLPRVKVSRKRIVCRTIPTFTLLAVNDGCCKVLFGPNYLSSFNLVLNLILSALEFLATVCRLTEKVGLNCRK